MPKLKVSPIKRFHTSYEIDPITGCHNWIGSKVWGYGKFWDNKQYRAHRWIYEYLNGPIPEGLVVRHMCHNRSCVNPEHLELGTHQDNMDDMIKAGRVARGEKNASNTELTKEVVILIKKFLKRHNGYGVSAFLGRWFNIKRRTICDIKLGKTWSWLEV